jgi:hypothetical protein
MENLEKNQAILCHILPMNGVQRKQNADRLFSSHECYSKKAEG